HPMPFVVPVHPLAEVDERAGERDAVRELAGAARVDERRRHACRADCADERPRRGADDDVGRRGVPPGGAPDPLESAREVRRADAAGPARGSRAGGRRGPAAATPPPGATPGGPPACPPPPPRPPPGGGATPPPPPSATSAAARASVFFSS